MFVKPNIPAIDPPAMNDIDSYTSIFFIFNASASIITFPLLTSSILGAEFISEFYNNYEVINIWIYKNINKHDGGFYVTPPQVPLELEEVLMNACFISNEREVTNDESTNSVQYIGAHFQEIFVIANLSKRMASLEHDVARLMHYQDQVSIRNLQEQGRMALWKKYGQQFLQASPDSCTSYETFDKVTRSRSAVFKPKFWIEFILYVKDEWDFPGIEHLEGGEESEYAAISQGIHHESKEDIREAVIKAKNPCLESLFNVVFNESIERHDA